MAAATRLDYGTHPEQYICVHRPEPSAEPRLAVLVHGGFWKAKYSLSNAGTGAVAAALVARGWHVADVEYRRVGHEGGGWPGSNHDVLAALACIHAHMAAILPAGRLPPRVAMFGHSAGGQLAIWAAHFAALAHRSGDASGGASLDSEWVPWALAGRALVPDLVVAIAPVSDLVEACRMRLSDEGDAVQNYLGGDPARDERASLAAARASPVAACVPCAVPTLVVSGRRDADVPTEIALRYVSQQPAALEPARGGAVPMALDDADHYAVFDGASAAFFAIVERAEAMLLAPAV